MNSVYKIPPPHVGTAGQEFLNRSKVQTSNEFLAGDVMLGVAEPAAPGGARRLVVTRLFDIGQSTLQMASERLTLTSNAHAAEVAECPTQGDTGCVAQAMYEGKVVLPAAIT
jgi:hypothetical protein